MAKIKGTSIEFSPIHGIGLFATKDFDAGEEVYDLAGTVIDRKRYGDWIFRFDPNKQFGMHWIQVSETSYMDPRDFGKYLNHSCDPNCGIHGTRLFVARRPIYRGEEVTFDYAMSDWDYFHFSCQCGEDACRGEVQGYKHLPPVLRSAYRGFVSRYLEGSPNYESIPA